MKSDRNGAGLAHQSRFVFPGDFVSCVQNCMVKVRFTGNQLYPSRCSHSSANDDIDSLSQSGFSSL